MRRPLGRGLSALIEDTVGEARAADDGPALTMVPAERISPGPFQPRRRFDPQRLEELTRAVKSQGVIEPLIVRPRPRVAGIDGPRYEVIAGERRLRAARAAGLRRVPVIVRELDARQALEISLVENLAREDLNVVEQAHALERLRSDFELSHEQIATRIGKSRPYVSNALRLLDLPEVILEWIELGRLTAGQVRPLLALPSAEARISAARRIIEGSVSARGVEQIARARRRAAANGAATPDDANLTALAEGLQRALKRKVKITSGRGKSPGRIEIEFYDDDDLTALVRMLMKS